MTSFSNYATGSAYDSQGPKNTLASNLDRYTTDDLSSLSFPGTSATVVCTTELDKTSDTVLATVTGMTTPRLPPGEYSFEIHLAGTAGALGGWNVGLKQGTASMLGIIDYTADAKTASAIAVTHGTSTTDQASIIAATTAYIEIDIKGSFVVTTAGTLSVQMAQNASNSTATSVYVGSYFTVNRIS